MPFVVLIGTLDTKGTEYAFLRDLVETAGCTAVVVDTGVLGDPVAAADVSRAEVAAAGGADLASLAAGGDRGVAVDAMAAGAEQVALDLYGQGRLDAVLAVGGSGGTSIATRAMRALPVGVGKMMVSTVAAGDTRSYVGDRDVTMMYSIVDISGINRVSGRVLRNAAAAAAGMAAEHERGRTQAAAEPKPVVAATMFGVTTPCVEAARVELEALGYEVLVFHATGTGGASMESLIRAGEIAAVLDVTTTELVDDLVGGVCSAGPERLTAAGDVGVPQVVSVGALDMANFGAADTVPARFAGRTMHRHNAAVMLLRTSVEENVEVGRRMARKLNAARGPVTVFLPVRGVSAVSTAGQVFHDEAADEALFDTLRAELSERVELVPLDTDINDPSFARAMARRLDEQYRGSRSTTQVTSGYATTPTEASGEA